MPDNKSMFSDEYEIGAGTTATTPQLPESKADEEYTSGTQTTASTVPNAEVTATELPEVKVEAEKYGLGKPQRRTLRARIL